VCNRDAVVGDHHGPSCLEGREVGELPSPKAVTQGSCRAEACPWESRCARDQVGYQPGVVNDRAGVRHADDGAEPACGRSGQPAGEVLLDLLPRLAKVCMQVEERRCDRRVGGVELGVHVPSQIETFDGPVLEVQVVSTVVARAVDEPAATQNYAAHRRPTSSVYSTAIRTGTPLPTCRSITLVGPSASADSISTSRFIGPGCMTTAPGAAKRITRSVS